MTATKLKAKFDSKKKVFKIQMSKDKVIEIASSGMFDTERELLSWASQNKGRTLGFLDGSQKHQYLLVYDGKLYDVETEAKVEAKA